VPCGHNKYSHVTSASWADASGHVTDVTDAKMSPAITSEFKSNRKNNYVVMFLLIDLAIIYIQKYARVFCVCVRTHDSANIHIGDVCICDTSLGRLDVISKMSLRCLRFRIFCFSKIFIFCFYSAKAFQINRSLADILQTYVCYLYGAVTSINND